MGSSKRVEKIYFEIQESWLEQWSKQQIRDSKNAFLFNVLQDDGGDQGKLEAFINFCEDTIFEVLNFYLTILIFLLFDKIFLIFLDATCCRN